MSYILLNNFPLKKTVLDGFQEGMPFLVHDKHHVSVERGWYPIFSDDSFSSVTDL